MSGQSIAQTTSGQNLAKKLKPAPKGPGRPGAFRRDIRAFRLGPGAVLVACRDFYGAHLAAERDYTRDLPQTAAAYDALAARAESLPDHACLVYGWPGAAGATPPPRPAAFLLVGVHIYDVAVYVLALGRRVARSLKDV